jgi:hypothetical protein
MNLTGELHARPSGSALVKWSLLALVAALMPVVVALVLFVSAARRRPLLGRRGAPELAQRLTIIWGVGILVIGLLQGASAVFAGMSVTNPTDFLIRTVASLALVGALYVGVRAYLRRG